MSIYVKFRYNYRGWPITLECDLSQLNQTDSLRKVLETVEAKIDEWIQEAKRHE